MSVKINYSKKAPGNTSANLIIFSNEDYKFNNSKNFYLMQSSLTLMIC